MTSGHGVFLKTLFACMKRFGEELPIHMFVYNLSRRIYFGMYMQT